MYKKIHGQSQGSRIEGEDPGWCGAGGICGEEMETTIVE